MVVFNQSFRWFWAGKESPGSPSSQRDRAGSEHRRLGDQESCSLDRRCATTRDLKEYLVVIAFDLRQSALICGAISALVFRRRARSGDPVDSGDSGDSPVSSCLPMTAMSRDDDDVGDSYGFAFPDPARSGCDDGDPGDSFPAQNHRKDWLKTTIHQGYIT